MCLETDLGVGVVAGAGAAVVLELAVADAEGVGGLLIVGGAGVVRLVAGQGRQAVARTRAAVHGRDGRPRLCVLVHHRVSLARTVINIIIIIIIIIIVAILILVTTIIVTMAVNGYIGQSSN